MRFSINQAELKESIAVVAKGSSTRSTLSILAGIHISAVGSQVTLQATDLELSIRMVIPALVEEEGATVAPAKLLSDIIKSLPDQAVQVKADETGMSVSCDKTTFTLKTLDAHDFPEFPEVALEREASFPFSTFSTMVKSVARDVSRDETRAILTGVLISQIGNELKMVATDSYRLAVASSPIEHPSVEEFEAVVSGSFLSDIAALPNSAEPITLALSENQIVVRYNGVTFINRRIEGTFPNYRQLIGGQHTTRATVDTQAVMAAVRRVSLLSNRVSPIQLSVDAEAGLVTCMTSSQDVGNAQEDLTAEVEGESVSIAFNHQFLLDGLSSIKTDTVHIDLSGSMRPGILRSAEESDFLYLIMPVRV